MAPLFPLLRQGAGVVQKNTIDEEVAGRIFLQNIFWIWKNYMEKKKRPKKNQYSTDEAEAAKRVLKKLSDRTKIEYGLRGGDAHTAMIVSRMRSGVSEIEMRAIIAYCWSELDWENKRTGDGTAMAKYLRPETLFGPVTIDRYLAPARAWLFAHYPEEFEKINAQKSLKL